MVLTAGKITELREKFEIENKFSTRMFTREIWNESRKEYKKDLIDKFHIELDEKMSKSFTINEIVNLISLN